MRRPLRAGEGSHSIQGQEPGLLVMAAVGNKEGRYQVSIANRWLDTSGAAVLNAVRSYGVPSDLQPGSEVSCAFWSRHPRLVTI